MSFERIRKLYRFRELLFMLTIRDFKLRYKQTVMGVLWALLMPVAVVAAGMIIRLVAQMQKSRGSRSHRSSSSRCRGRFSFRPALLDQQPAGQLQSGGKSRISERSVSAGSITACLTDFAISLIAGTIALLLLGHQFPATTPIAFALLLPIIALVTGAGLLLSSLNLFFRDVKFIVEVILMFAIFFTPVLYNVEMLGKWAPLVLVNPMAPLLEGIRDTAVLGQMPDPCGRAMHASCRSSCCSSAIELIQESRIHVCRAHLTGIETA